MLALPVPALKEAVSAASFIWTRESLALAPCWSYCSTLLFLTAPLYDDRNRWPPYRYRSSAFVIAEMSGNHNQSLERALEIVEAAAKAGAHAIKLQTYTADTMTLNVRGGSFEIQDPDSLWAGKNLHDLYKLAYTPWDWHAPIIQRAQEHGMACFSSPFDESAVDFLEELDVPAYKIASFENSHLPLISKAASTGKPLIISTGMASLGELERAVCARSAGCKELIFSSAPAPIQPPANTNIRTTHLRELFCCGSWSLGSHHGGWGSCCCCSHGCHGD